MVYTLFRFSSKYSLFHNSNVFVSFIIHILYTGCAKIKINNSRPQKVKNTPKNTKSNAKLKIFYIYIYWNKKAHISSCYSTLNQTDNLLVRTHNATMMGVRLTIVTVEKQ